MDPTKTNPTSPLMSIAMTLATKGLTLLSGVMVTHGIMTASQTETFVSAGLLVVSLLAMGWREYGSAIFFSQMEVLKAKSLAQAAALKKANLPPVTATQIAAQSPTLTPADVVKAVATLPAESLTPVADMSPVKPVTKVG